MLELYKEYSGAEFNKAYEGIKLYKFMFDSLVHRGFKYRLGLNTDTTQFDPTGKCKKGGLYFCEESKCHYYVNQYGNKLALIEIPDDARVYVEENKFKSDKLFIKDIIDCDKINDEFWINIIHDNGLALEYVKNQTHEICELAIRQNYEALYFVREQTPELCKLAIQRSGNALCYVNQKVSLPEDVYKLAVQQDGHALRYIKDEFRTNELCVLAVKQNGFALGYIKEQFQTEKLCELAVTQNGLALANVINQTENICILAMKQDHRAYSYVKDKFRTVEVCRYIKT